VTTVLIRFINNLSLIIATLNEQILKLKSKRWKMIDLITYLTRLHKISSSSAQRLLFDYRGMETALLALVRKLYNKMIQLSLSFKFVD
jgi:hypothetical protein